MGEIWQKERKKLGRFIDKHNISQEWLRKKTKLSKNTLTRLCSVNPKNDYRSKPPESIKKLIELTIREKVPQVKPADLWDES